MIRFLLLPALLLRLLLMQGWVKFGSTDGTATARLETFQQNGVWHWRLMGQRVDTGEYVMVARSPAAGYSSQSAALNAGTYACNGDARSDGAVIATHDAANGEWVWKMLSTGDVVLAKSPTSGYATEAEAREMGEHVLAGDFEF